MNLSVRENLLEKASFYVRTCGYAAFSYADLARDVGITKASVHHYFPRKEDLAAAIIAEHVANYRRALEEILAGSDRAATRLRAYAATFQDGLELGMLPLCGALSAERDALPEPVRKDVCHFFELHLAWLEQVVRAGVAGGELRSTLDPARTANLLLATLEGGSFIGWTFANSGPILSAFEDVLGLISVQPER